MHGNRGWINLASWWVVSQFDYGTDKRAPRFSTMPFAATVLPDPVLPRMAMWWRSAASGRG